MKTPTPTPARWIWLVASVLLALAGAAVPAYLRHLHPAVVRAAGVRGPGWETLAEEALQEGKTGPAGWILSTWEVDGGDAGSAIRADLVERRVRILQENPGLRATGGPDPYFEQFASLPEVAAPSDPSPTVAAWLFPEAHRRALDAFLAYSARTLVRDLRACRQVTGTTLFEPAFSPAGQPFDVALLSMALLAQGEHLPSGWVAALREWAPKATAGNLEAVRLLERVSLAVLTLARRADWATLVALVEACPDPGQAQLFAALLRQWPDATGTLGAALLATGDPAGLHRFLEAGRPADLAALRFAVAGGPAAVRFFLDQARPLRFVPAADAPRAFHPPEFLARWTAAAPAGALVAKWALWAVSGAVLVAGLTAWRAGPSAPVGPPLVHRSPWRAVRTVCWALAWLGLWVVATEPDLLRLAGGGAASLRLDFTSGGDGIAGQAQPLASAMLDPSSLIALALYALIQVAIYVMGILKIAEVRRQKLPPDLALKLLENEDSLFDLALYVGLGGTVGSLLLLAMNVYQASLVAAYASTFFGIIFGATLKIGHVRPYRRQLILEMEQGRAQSR